jgi:Peptidase MA superfamily
MNRAVIVAGVLIVLVCLACAGFGAWLMFLPQAQPVTQITPVPAATSSAATPLPAQTAVVKLATPFHSVTGPAQAAHGISVTRSKFTNSFPQQLSFEIDAQSSLKITQIALFVAFDGQSSSSREVPDFTPDTQVQATYSWDLGRDYVPPGVTGQYWWTIQDSRGALFETTKQAFRVDDIAHQWKKISNDQLALYWYAGDNAFGQALFNRGVQAMKFLQQDTGVTVNHQIQIFIYGNRSDFFDALEPGATEWTGGRAFPEFSIVLIDVAPSNLDWGLGATTHELTHQVIHQKIKSPLGDLSMPHWMDEGLAVYYETYPGALDPQFAVPLKRAIQNDSLQQLRSLAGSFPADSTAANLSYAESYSVVDFIIRHYGRDKLAQLLQGFKTGGFYDDIFEQVLGVDTDGLENAWRVDVGAKPRVIATRAATTPTPFPTFSLSTDTTPAPSK